MLQAFKKGERVSADKMNTMRRQTLRSTPYEAGLITPHGWTLMPQPKRRAAPSENESIWAFGMEYTPTQCTVYAGSILFDKAWREYATDTITLNGTPCYVYVSMTRAGYVCSLKQANTKPTDTGSEINLLIAEFTASAGIYTLVRRHWRHSYNADANLPT